MSTFGIRPRTLDLASRPKRRSGCMGAAVTDPGAPMGKQSWVFISRHWCKQERGGDKEQFMRKQIARAASSAPSCSLVLRQPGWRGMGSSRGCGWCLFVLGRILALNGRVN